MARRNKCRSILFSLTRHLREEDGKQRRFAAYLVIPQHVASTLHHGEHLLKHDTTAVGKHMRFEQTVPRADDQFRDHVFGLRVSLLLNRLRNPRKQLVLCGVFHQR